MLRFSFTVALFVTLSSSVFDLSYLYSAIISFIAYIFTGGYPWLKLIWKTLPRDLYGAKCFFKIEYRMKQMVKKNTTIANIFVEQVGLHPHKLAFISADNNTKFTYEEANKLSNKIANYFIASGYKKGDVVSLLMENRIEYIPIWLGLSKAGLISSLLNTNLKKDSLEHCLKASNSRGLIFTDLYEDIVNSADVADTDLFSFSAKKSSLKGSKDLCKLLETVDNAEPTNQENSLLDQFMYIFTSGTTGFPKAAIIRGIRFASMGYGNAIFLDLRSDDIGYCALPLYHTTGGVGLAGACIFNGATLVVRKKFSASKFFDDCCKFNCTAFNYIGEVCTYLLAQPAKPSDRKHQIRSIVGAGLRPTIWKEFQERFNISHICEVYGATEGNASTINLSGHVGAVGFKSLLFPSLLPIKLVKLNNETGEILRDGNGIAIEAAVGEPGEIVGKIKEDAVRQFDGYVNKEATQKTIVHDIFVRGDSAFRSGDILVVDEEGYFYFHDRTGDTFRWKGENVSTNEVEGMISKSLDMAEVCVYGVKVPNCEGKAGMACIADPERKIIIEHLYEKLSALLPTYAIPVFIRRSNKISTTGSFKYQKVSLQKEGYDIHKCQKDEIFVFEKSTKVFKLLDEKLYNDIQSLSFSF